jgi:hypothetical protein
MDIHSTIQTQSHLKSFPHGLSDVLLPYGKYDFADIARLIGYVTSVTKHFAEFVSNYDSVVSCMLLIVITGRRFRFHLFGVRHLWRFNSKYRAQNIGHIETTS